MARWSRWLVLATALMVLATACGSSLDVDTTDAPPTPLPTPVVIPTIAPLSPTPTSEVLDGTLASGAPEAQATAEDPTAAPDPTPEVQPTPTVTPFPTPTAGVIELDTPVARPTVGPTRAPAPTRVASPTPAPQRQQVQQQQQAPRPVVVPTTPPAPSGACPAGTTNRASDGQCVPFCSQSQLTISNSCVCTGEFFDNGGQCVKRCLSNEVPNGRGGCAVPTSTSP